MSPANLCGAWRWRRCPGGEGEQMGERARARSLSNNSIVQNSFFPGSPGALTRMEALAGLSPEMSWLLAKKPLTSKYFILESAHSSVDVQWGTKAHKMCWKVKSSPSQSVHRPWPGHPSRPFMEQGEELWSVSFFLRDAFLMSTLPKHTKLRNLNSLSMPSRIHRLEGSAWDFGTG